MTDNQDLESLFYFTDGWILVGLSYDLEDRFREEVSGLGYEVPKIDLDALKRLGPHLIYWTFLRENPEHFVRWDISRFLQVKTKAGQEEEAIEKLRGIDYVMFAERMYGMCELE